MNCYQIVCRIYPVANLYAFLYIPYKTELNWWKPLLKLTKDWFGFVHFNNRASLY